MSVVAAIRRMMDERGFTLEQALSAAEVMEAEVTGAVDAQADRRRAADRLRKRLRKSAESAETADAAEDDDTLDKKDVPQTPLEKTNPKTPSAPKGASFPAGFAEFWILYPNKVGKPKAEKAYVKAVRRATFETIMAGLRRYVVKADDRPWCNPATWLNDDRWDELPAVVARGSPSQSQPNSIHAAAANLARRLQDADDRSDQGNFADQPLAIGFSSRQ